MIRVVVVVVGALWTAFADGARSDVVVLTTGANGRPGMTGDALADGPEYDLTNENNYSLKLWDAK